MPALSCMGGETLSILPPPPHPDGDYCHHIMSTLIWPYMAPHHIQLRMPDKDNSAIYIFFQFMCYKPLLDMQ